MNSGGSLVGGSQMSSELSWRYQRTGKTYESVRFPLKKNQVKAFKPGIKMSVNGTAWESAPKVQFKCDKASYVGSAGGCAFHSFYPTLTMSKTGKAPRTARHIATAQGKIPYHFGRPGSRHPLNRSTDADINAGNRKQALKMCAKQKEPYSCDEYPFATTYQGCMYVVNWSGGRCHVKGVPLADNKRGGSLLSSFYVKQRVLAYDAFWVRIVK